MKKRIILGITGSIAAYKTPELIRSLINENIQVVPITTPNAHKFVTELSLKTVANHPVLQDEYNTKEKIPHLDIGKSNDILVIAPATANFINKVANGIADNLLTNIFLAFTGPKLIVPAMNKHMYLNPITQENILKLKKYQVHFLGPIEGNLACGDIGIGKMVALPLIIEKIKSLYFPQLNLNGKRILITAGGTSEPIDSVRIITNKSTGKMGHTLADLAGFYKAKVTLVTTKEKIINPEIAKVITVETVEEMTKAINQEIKNNDYLLMSAAISDYTPKKQIEKKIKREKNLTLDLIATNDILKSLLPIKKEKKYIGFCLETEDLLNRAKKKLREKQLDYIIANSIDVIGQNYRKVFIMNKNENIETIEGDLKYIAHKILETTIC